MTRPSPVRAAVLSAGAWSQHSHLPTLLTDPDVDIIGVSSPSNSIRQQIRQQWPHLPISSDWTVPLAASPDLVIVSSPPTAHEEMVMAALRGGAHVLVEKPFAPDRASAQRMADTAAATRRALLVGYSWSNCPAIRAGSGWVDSLGTIDHVEARLVVNTPALLTASADGGWGGQVPTTPSTYTDPRLSGGGAGMVNMSHLLAILLWLTHESVVEVSAATYPAAHPLDLHLSFIARTVTGARMTVNTVSGQPQLDRPEWLIGLYGPGGDLRIDTAHDTAWFASADGALHHFTEPDAGRVDQHYPTRTALDVARGGDVPAALNAGLAVDVAAVTDAAYRSAATRRWEPVSR